MKDILIIGAGGVGSVAAHKCAMLSDTFGQITLASRSVGRCEAVARSIKERFDVTIATRQIDADDSEALKALLSSVKPYLVLNLALPYQDLVIMDACLEAGAHYLDTANYEPIDTAKFEYHWQWAYHDRLKERGLMALLGAGFDPGATNGYFAYIQKHLLDEIHEIDIIDVNGGSNGYPFSTNFSPEVNIREVSAACRHFEAGKFIETPAMSEKRRFCAPQGIGEFDVYRMYHEEMESITKNYPSIKKAQFFMGFSKSYLTHLEVIKNLGLDGIQPVDFQGQKIVPLQFLSALLPNPATLGEITTGKICIGVLARGIKDGKPAEAFVYNITDHQDCFKEVGSQGVSYTAGAPAAMAAKLIVDGDWLTPGAINVETLNPDPFLTLMNQHGLPYFVQKETKGLYV